MKHIQRNYYPGEEWLYFKIYTGITTGEKVLLDILYPFANSLIKSKIIGKWFFIRYSDPEFHLRIRFHILDIQNIGNIMCMLQKKLKHSCQEHFIHNIAIDTYSREIERYGNTLMETSESIFYYDSVCICTTLKQCRTYNNANYRWMLAFRMINNFFNALEIIDAQEKIKYLNQMDTAYKAEFGYTVYNAKQLNELYRKFTRPIKSILQPSQTDEIMIHLVSIIEKRDKQIKKLLKNNQEKKEINIISCIHMMMNRLFPNQNRIHELLIYNFLHRYYTSEIARSTYNL